MVLYLSSETSPVSGGISNAGMGFFNRAAVVTGPGVVIGKDEQIPSPEDLVAQWDQVVSLKSGKEYGHLNEQIGDLLAAFDAPAAEEAPAAAGFSSAAAVFESMPDAFQADAAADVDTVFQYHISGDQGGEWHCTNKDGTCTVDAGVHDQPVCTLKMGDADFLDLMNGKLPAMQAYTSGKLKIEGDIMKSQLIEKLFKF